MHLTLMTALLLASTVGVDAPATQEGPLASLLPEQVETVTLDPDSVAEVPAENLWDLIDGQTEVFLPYRVTRGLQAIYEGQGDVGILVALYAFDTSENAYGLYSYYRPEDAEPVRGLCDAVAIRNSVLVRKANVVGQFSGFDERPETVAAVRAVAKAVAERIEGRHGEPALVTALPTAGLRKGSVVHLHSKQTLDQLDHPIKEDVFGFGSGAEMVLATYALATATAAGEVPQEGDAPKARFFALLYPNEKAAGAARARYEDWLADPAQQDARAGTRFLSAGRVLVGTWNGNVAGSGEQMEVIADALRTHFEKPRGAGAAREGAASRPMEAKEP